MFIKLLFCVCMMTVRLLSVIDYSVPHIEGKSNIVPAAVIGSGPAGLAAALYIARGGFTPTVFAGPKPGGQLMGSSLVENIPGFEKLPGKEIMERKLQHVMDFGVHYIPETVMAVDFTAWPFTLTLSNHDIVHALTVIIATGASPRMLQVPGEADLLGHGVSTCAVCDAPLFDEEDVIIVGGGDSAVNAALLLKPYAKSITLLNRSGLLRASQRMQQHLAHEKITVHYNKKVHEIHGEDEISHITIEDMVTGEKSCLESTGLFLAIGHTPNTQLFQEQLALTGTGHIQVMGKSQETSVRGVFAAGEVVDDVYRQAIVAEGEGARAGLDAIGFLHAVGVTEDVLNRVSVYQYSEVD